MSRLKCNYFTKEVLILAVLQVFLFSVCFGSDQLTDDSTGVKFPKEIKFEHAGKEYVLEITGVSTRSKFFMKIYSVAHYMENPKKESRKALMEEVLTGNKAKVIRYHWLRKVDAENIEQAYNEGFRINLTEEQREKLKPDIERLLEYLNHAAMPDDIHEYRWYPDGDLEFWINGKLIGTFKDPDFIKGLWFFWFGPQSVVKRDDLINLYTN